MEGQFRLKIIMAGFITRERMRERIFEIHSQTIAIHCRTDKWSSKYVIKKFTVGFLFSR